MKKIYCGALLLFSITTTASENTSAPAKTPAPGKSAAKPQQAWTDMSRNSGITTPAPVKSHNVKAEKKPSTPSSSECEQLTLDEEISDLPMKRCLELFLGRFKTAEDIETALGAILAQDVNHNGWRTVKHTLENEIIDRGAWRGSYSRALKSEMESADFRAALSPFQENPSQSPQQQAAARAAHMKKKLQILEKVTTALNESTQKAENVIIDFNTAMKQALKIATSELQKQQWYTHHNLNTFLELAGKGSLPEDYRTTLADRQKKLRESLGDTLRRCATFTTQQTANSFAISQTANPEQKIPKKTFHSFALTSLTASLKRKQDRKAVALKTAQEQAEREMVQAAKVESAGTTAATDTGGGAAATTSSLEAAK